MAKSKTLSYLAIAISLISLFWTIGWTIYNSSRMEKLTGLEKRTDALVIIQSQHFEIEKLKSIFNQMQLLVDNNPEFRAFIEESDSTFYVLLTETMSCAVTAEKELEEIYTTFEQSNDYRDPYILEEIIPYLLRKQTIFISTTQNAIKVSDKLNQVFDRFSSLINDSQEMN